MPWKKNGGRKKRCDESPWILWPRVTEKVENSNCQAICTCPDWKRRWVKNLVDMAVKKIYFPRGRKLFEGEVKILRGTKATVLGGCQGGKKIGSAEDREGQTTFVGVCH